MIDPAKKRALESLCAKQDLTPSQVVRKLIRDYLAFYHEPWTPTGDSEPDEPEA